MAAELNPAAPIFIPAVAAAVADSFLPLSWYPLPPPPPPLFNLSFSKSSVFVDGSLFYYQPPSFSLPQHFNDAYYSCYFPPAKNYPPAIIGAEAVRQREAVPEKSHHTGKGWRGGHHGCRQFIGRSFGSRMCWVPKASSGEKRRIPVSRRCTEEDFQFKEEVGKDGFGGGAGRSTVMIKNIPNKLSKPQIIDLLDDHCRRENQKIQKEAVDSDLTEFDFLYLPMDFISGNNLGYAFVNYTNPAAARKLHRDLHMKPWSHCGSRKICHVTYAKIQGVEELVKHFRHSIFCCSSAEYLPVFFKPSRDGCRDSTEQLIGRFSCSEPRKQ